MNKITLAFVIAITTSLIITLLMYSAGVLQGLLTTVFFVAFFVNFIITWLVLEFVVFRDGQRIKELITSFLKGVKSKDIPEVGLRLNYSKQINRSLRILQRRKEKEIKILNERADFRSQFIADISHELKTPIFAAQGYIHTLLDGALDDEEVRYKFLHKSANSLDFLDKLVKDLLELSQIETGNIILMYDHFDIIQLIDEVIDDFEQQAEIAQITIKRSKKPAESIVYADFVRIRQVLQNLISNGIKYNAPNGELLIEVMDQVDDVTISITDTGIGIPKNDLPQIFKRFYRVDKSRTKTKKKSSTGLGLAIVKHLLEVHGSAIEVKSEIGKGSVFSFSLQKDKPQPNGKRTQTEELDII